MKVKRTVSALLALSVLSSANSLGLTACSTRTQGSETLKSEAISRSKYTAGDSKPNLLLITADDLNYDSLGFTGSPVENISPNLDRLASEGMFLQKAHVGVAVCQPSRETLMTGLYPHNSGAIGFVPIKSEVTTLQEQLRKNGYMNGIIGKVTHLAPEEKFCWDFIGDIQTPAQSKNKLDSNGKGRSPVVYYNETKKFLQKAKSEGKPFFFMANSLDPHRPFAGSEQELSSFKKNTAVSRQYQPKEVNVPGFLPDLEKVRLEVSEYYSSVHRLDETVGSILKALDEEGLADNTLVMFLSDNGMSMPFAKSNCYLTSTHTPWLVRWPGKVQPGSVDQKHFVSGMDYMPTILEAVGIPAVNQLDGSSFLPVLIGQEQAGRESVFTSYNANSGNHSYTMRGLQDQHFGYIFNPWSYTKEKYQVEPMSGRTFKAMSAAANKDEAIADRVKILTGRTVEEFYDYEKDPYALHNLISDPAYQDEINQFRTQLYETMAKAKDPIAPALKEYMENGSITASQTFIPLPKGKKKAAEDIED